MFPSYLWSILSIIWVFEKSCVLFLKILFIVWYYQAILRLVLIIFFCLLFPLSFSYTFYVLCFLLNLWSLSIFFFYFFAMHFVSLIQSCACVKSFQPNQKPNRSILLWNRIHENLNIFQLNTNKSRIFLRLVVHCEWYRNVNVFFPYNSKTPTPNQQHQKIKQKSNNCKLESTKRKQKQSTP